MGSLIIPNLVTPACCKLQDTSAAGVLEYVNLQYPKPVSYTHLTLPTKA